MLFLGRMTRQKGLRYLLDALPDLAPEAQVVLCAGAADTPDMAREFDEASAFATATDRDYLDSGYGATTDEHCPLLARSGLLLPIDL